MKSNDGILHGTDGLPRCFWCGADEEYTAYHDHEWGFPVSDDHRLFEKLCLEGFQAGLSWRTILKKRENFRSAFDRFDFERVSRFTETDVERLLKDAGIVRHRGKIVSTIHNARRACDLMDEFGSLAAYVWRFEPPADERPELFTWDELRGLAHTRTSRALSRDLKKRGWTFVGPTTVYAFMQAMGLVNDHLDGCHVRAIVQERRTTWRRPTWAGSLR